MSGTAVQWRGPQLPRCLCLHVGRVEWRGGALSKRGEFVAFPEALAMAPYALVQQRQVSAPPCLARHPTGSRGRLLYRILTIKTRA